MRTTLAEGLELPHMALHGQESNGPTDYVGRMDEHLGRVLITWLLAY